jgi:hypothetical protein
LSAPKRAFERVSPQDRPASQEEPGHGPVGTDTPRAVRRPSPLGTSSAAQGQYEDTWESSDGLSYAEGKVIPPGDPWPALVSVDAIDLDSLAEHDARSLVAWLTSLADAALHMNSEASHA